MHSLIRMANCERYLVSVLLLMFSGNSQADLAAELTTEVAYGFHEHRFSKAETMLELEWTGMLTDDADFTLTPRISVDLADQLTTDTRRPDSYSSVNGPIGESSHARFELYEAYSDFEVSGVDVLDVGIRLGKQQVVWGQADGLKVLDVVNPQKFREFNLPDFDDSRIPTWMVNAEWATGDDSSLQLLIIPDLSFNELADAGSPFELTSPEIIPPAVPGIPVVMSSVERPSAGHLETGLRWSAFTYGWDVSLNYFYHYQDNPVIYREFDGSKVNVSSSYERNHLLGMTASNAFDNWVLRLELGVNSDTWHIRSDIEEKGVHNSPEVASVVGLDYQGWTDWLVSYQWYQSTLTDYEPGIVRKETSLRHTLLFRKNLWNETLELELFTLFNQDYNDGQVQVKASYQLDDDWTVWGGVDVFYGDEEGLFGQFDENDRVVMGVQTHF